MLRSVLFGLACCVFIGCDGAKAGGDAKPGASAAKTNDLYMRVENMYFGGRLSLDVQFYLLSPAGKFYQGVPIGGPDSFDWDKAAREHPKQTGTYSINGDKITFKYVEGKDRTASYKPDPNGFLLDGLIALKLGRFDDGKVLDGAWGGGAMAGSGGTTVSSARSWVFNKDGTYRLSTVGGFSAVTSKGDSVGGGSSGEDSGTYKISGQTLTLKHKDGKTTQHTIFPYEMDKGEIWLGVDSGPMKPEKK